MTTHGSETIRPIIEIAQTHASRLTYAIKKLAHHFPLSAKTVLAIPDDELPMFEFYTSRFSKLQDLMGNALFPKLLAAVGDLTEGMTFIDKLNRLEKLGIIESTDAWMTMRQIRNHLSHEYPNQPELTAVYLNEAFESGQQLLSCLENTIQFSKKRKLL
jgi:hypothetical protein